jgi:hypothetical protein
MKATEASALKIYIPTCRALANGYQTFDLINNGTLVNSMEFFGCETYQDPEGLFWLAV